MTAYKDAVTEAQRLVKRSEADQWRLAELTWEQVEEGISRRDWARDVGVNETTAQRWYKVWDLKINMLESGSDISYSDAWNRVIGRVDANYGAAEIRKATPERKAEIARELLAEPEIADAVVADPKTAQVTRDALGISPEEVAAAIKRDPVVAAAASASLDDRVASAPKPTPRDESQYDKFTRAIIAGRVARKQLATFADAVSGASFDGEQQEAFIALLDSIDMMAGMVRVGLRSGTWDDALADLTKGI